MFIVSQQFLGDAWPFPLQPVHQVKHITAMREQQLDARHLPFVHTHAHKNHIMVTLCRQVLFSFQEKVTRRVVNLLTDVKWKTTRDAKQNKEDPGHLPQQWSICACPRAGSTSYVPQWLNEWTVAAWAISHNGSMKWRVSLPVSLMFLTLHVNDIAVVLDQRKKQEKEKKEKKRRAE